jgi:glycerophosphoryl diester phosphodiesterase
MGCRTARTSRRIALALTLSLLAFTGCDDGDNGVLAPPANVVVRDRIDALAPAANLGHRGTGVNAASNPFAENSLASFAAAMGEGADGIELDVEITADGVLVVMHDDTLDRTTTCSGCVSAFTFDEVRECRLVDGSGEVTGEPPPTLEEVFSVLPATALVNVELKAYGAACATDDTGPEALATAAAQEIHRLGVADRTLFSSFDMTAAGTIKVVDPDLYSALLAFGFGADHLATSLALGLDAAHPFFLITAADVAAIRDAGLQVNVYTVNSATAMRQTLDKDVSSIITDEPDVLVDVLEELDG